MVDDIQQVSALAGILSGLVYELSPGNQQRASSGRDTRISTKESIFVGTARLASLEKVLEKRCGETGVCEILPADLTAAGMPECLVNQFPVTLVLPSIQRAAFEAILRKERHPGFGFLSEIATTLGATDVDYHEGATRALIKHCWTNRADFSRLGQILAALAGSMHEIPVKDKVLTINEQNVIDVLLQNEILPSDVS